MDDNLNVGRVIHLNGELQDLGYLEREMQFGIFGILLMTGNTEMEIKS